MEMNLNWNDFIAHFHSKRPWLFDPFQHRRLFQIYFWPFFRSWIKRLLMQSFKIQLNSCVAFWQIPVKRLVSADIFVFFQNFKVLVQWNFPEIKCWSEVGSEVSRKFPLLIISVILWETGDFVEGFDFIIWYTCSEF